MKDTKFMTAKEKDIVLKQWGKFIKTLSESSGEKTIDEYSVLFRTFTKRIYNHLTLHCSFIAHYNINGFFETYFFNPENTMRFISQFDSDYGKQSIEYGMSWGTEDYADLNDAMCEVVDKYKEVIYKGLTEKLKQDKLREIEKLKTEVENLG